MKKTRLLLILIIACQFSCSEDDSSEPLDKEDPSILIFPATNCHVLDLFWLNNETILVADDDPKIVKALTHVLTEEGYRVISAADGEEALRRFRLEQPDLVIIDYMMPKKDGLEVCRILTTEVDVPIIMLSAKGEETDRIVGFRMGVDDYLTNPLVRPN